MKKEYMSKSYSEIDLTDDIKKVVSNHINESKLQKRGAEINRMLSALDNMQTDNIDVQAKIDKCKKETLTLQIKHQKQVDEHLSKIASLVISSKGTDKYGLPKDIGYVEKTESFKADKDEIDLLITSIKEAIDESEYNDLTQDQLQEFIDYTLDKIIPKMIDEIGIQVGNEFQKDVRIIKDLAQDCTINDDIQYHYDTLEECAVYYANQTIQGLYPSRRNAYRDAVDRGITYTNKYGQRVQLEKMKQLERAYDRVIDANKEDDLGLL